MKPITDWLISFVLLCLLLPILIIVSLVNLGMGLPVLFIHKRPGYCGEVFGLYKFCTIHPVSQKITGFSQFLRKTSLDELPQLFNVLKGEMSLIGPRPLLLEYLDKYTASQARRHLVKPGITGLAQVSGRNELTFEQKMVFDIKYVDKVSLGLDLMILFKTSIQLFRLKQADGHLRHEAMKLKMTP